MACALKDAEPPPPPPSTPLPALNDRLKHPHEHLHEHMLQAYIVKIPFLCNTLFCVVIPSGLFSFFLFLFVFFSGFLSSSSIKCNNNITTVIQTVLIIQTVFYSISVGGLKRKKILCGASVTECDRLETNRSRIYTYSIVGYSEMGSSQHKSPYQAFRRRLDVVTCVVMCL